MTDVEKKLRLERQIDALDREINALERDLREARKKRKAKQAELDALGQEELPLKGEA